MMSKILVTFAILIAATLCAPQGKVPDYIVGYQNVLNADGSFQFGYESSDGTKHEQAGTVKALGPNPEDAGIAIQGAYSFTGDDGKVYELRFTADENGFQPRADYLPPLPEYVLRQIAAAELEDRREVRPL